MKLATTLAAVPLILLFASHNLLAQEDDDWASLERYQEANAKLTPQESAENRVIF